MNIAARCLLSFSLFPQNSETKGRVKTVTFKALSNGRKRKLITIQLAATKATYYIRAIVKIARVPHPKLNSLFYFY